MNNKGFSIIELIVSFSLTMVIVIILFEIIVSMKDVYQKSVTQTELINKQNLFTDYIYSDIDSLGLKGVSVCGDNCISFTYRDGQVKNLVWSYYVENSENGAKQALQTLEYGGYKINLINNSSFDTNLSLQSDAYNLQGVKICYNIDLDSTHTTNYLSIRLPIYNSLFGENDFGLNILYTYKYSDELINLPLSSKCGEYINPEIE